MEINSEIFRAYDIRGVYGKDLTEIVASYVGKAFGTHLLERLSYQKMPTVVVGRDDRSSSTTLADEFIKGLTSTGCNVIYTGITVEPAIHFFSFDSVVDAAVNITASHNPKQYNGIKIDYKNADPCFGDDLKKLYKIIVTRKFAVGTGTVTKKDLNQTYIDYVSSKFKLKKKLKVVIYCGNGATSNIYPTILQNIGAEIIPIRCYLDPSFPKGVPDPATGNFYPELGDEVRFSKADIGIGFDGDGDRMGDVDENGMPYKADELGMLFAQDILKKHPGATIVFDVKCSQLLKNHIEKLGGKALMLRTGRSFFLHEMFNNNAMLGLELSGHLYFKDDYFGYDDGVYAVCRLLQLVSESGKTLSQLMSQFPKMISTPEIQVMCPDELKEKTMNELIKTITADKMFMNNITIDGIRTQLSETGWFIIRSSNTSPYLSFRAEGKNSKEVEHIMSVVVNLLAKYHYLSLEGVTKNAILKT